jgi:cytoskeletal protein CcmA (bactofilin family)
LSNTRKQQPEKISADCPHCGFSQLESAYAKSTICKRCSQHFSIEKLLAKEVSSLKPPSLFEKLNKMISRESVRDVHCFSCGARQEVSSAAESSSCPKCGSYIDLRDFRITGPFGRTVQTQGTVTVLPKGDVTTRILCGTARIEGKVRGTIICTGVVEIKAEGKMSGSVETEKLVVIRKCDVECQRPLKAKSMEVDGKITGELICDGLVTVQKHGEVIGVIRARSIVIEKGGIFRGDLHIGELPAPVAEQPKGQVIPLTNEVSRPNQGRDQALSDLQKKKARRIASN